MKELPFLPVEMNFGLCAVMPPQVSGGPKNDLLCRVYQCLQKLPPAGMIDVEPMFIQVVYWDNAVSKAFGIVFKVSKEK